MKFYEKFITGALLLISQAPSAAELKYSDISVIISKQEFSKYKDVSDFIDNSPKVTITVKPELEDIVEYGPDVVKSLTGFDCDRDGKMDDNKTCNAVYFKLWMKYGR